MAMMRGRTLVSTVLGVLALTLLSPTWPATAENYAGASGAGGCMPNDNIKADNSNHYLFYYDLTSQMITATDGALADDLTPTDLNIFYAGTFDGADVRVMDENYVTYCGYTWDGQFSNVFALAECTTVNGSNACGQFGLRYDTSDTNGFTAQRRESLACHELAHTVGLRHRAGGCLVSDASAAHLTTHDVNHINNNY
jgi:hypothetical protein